ncbi:hypothetical protein EXIGLDRAFT_726261 [Exidia glandulosa HHB12029]|uniref:Uncharacterized protein n=1 Tax=Exidia glandulosa HHB12029 TaxID=1314781 RepID=A0A165DU22_EXIGL|nr:hypothetical protein EXIGLDRAFT_726261 [Exidia glandulosa HHB12029]
MDRPGTNIHATRIPAPILRDLCVSCNSTDDVTLQLTSHIGESMLFAGQAPLLQSLDLGRLELPSAPTAAFDLSRTSTSNLR